MGATRVAKLRRGVSALGTAVAVMCGFLVATAPSAHAAFTVCEPGCALGPVDDNYTTIFNQKLTVTAADGLLANDSGPLGTKVDVADSDTQSWNGATVAVHADGSFTYTPDPMNPYSGIDSFDYWVQDNDGNTDLASVYLDVAAIVRGDTYYARVNTTLNVAAPGVLANDAAVDASTLTGDSVSAQGGAVTLNDDGSFSYTPKLDFAGTDTFGYDVLDLDDDNDYFAIVTVHVDSTPPTVTILKPSAAVTLSPKVAVQWSAVDSSGILHSQVALRTAPWNAGFGSLVNWKPSITATSTTLNGSYGRTYCFYVRATDKAANTSAWARRCTAVPLRARSLSYSSGWVTSTSTAYFGGEARYTKTKGARATRTNVLARHLYLVASKCPSCGSVQVRWNNNPVANVNLYRSAGAHRVVIPVANFTSTRAGTVTIIVTSASGKPVVIEGLGVLQT